MFGGFATLLWVGAILCFVAYGIQTLQAEEGDEVPADNVTFMTVLWILRPAITIKPNSCTWELFWQQSSLSRVLFHTTRSVSAADVLCLQLTGLYFAGRPSLQHHEILPYPFSARMQGD